MEYRFNAEDWATLTTEQRVRRCHLLAEQARKLADTAPPAMAATYLRIADDWLTLAAEIEATI
jgi:hypothetical protein